MNSFLVRSGDKFKVITDGDFVAAQLAEGSVNKYWLIKVAKSGNVTLKPVVQGNPKAEMVRRVTVEIAADGKIVGSTLVSRK